jgi:hypothetical protein
MKLLHQQARATEPGENGTLPRLQSHRSDFDEDSACGKSSLRNDKPATEAKSGDELDDKAKTSFDDGNEIKFFKSTET